MMVGVDEDVEFVGGAGDFGEVTAVGALVLARGGHWAGLAGEMAIAGRGVCVDAGTGVGDVGHGGLSAADALAEVERNKMPCRESGTLCSGCSGMAIERIWFASFSG